MKKVFSIFTVFILTLGIAVAQTKQDSVELKTGATITKAKFSEKVNGAVIKYKTVYLDNSTKTLFVIAYNKKKNRYERKYLPKNIEID
jgi:hypothetical protein